MKNYKIYLMLLVLLENGVAKAIVTVVEHSDSATYKFRSLELSVLF